MQRTETRSLSLYGTERNWKWIKDSNVRLDTLKVVEKIIGEILQDLSFGNGFLNMILIAHKIMAIIDYWDHIRVKPLCTEKETINRVMRWNP